VKEKECNTKEARSGHCPAQGMKVGKNQKVWAGKGKFLKQRFGKVATAVRTCRVMRQYMHSEGVMGKSFPIRRKEFPREVCLVGGAVSEGLEWGGRHTSAMGARMETKSNSSGER
jgi:hypothetical protein